jgi:hypothetical protein
MTPCAFPSPHRRLAAGLSTALAASALAWAGFHASPAAAAPQSVVSGAVWTDGSGQRIQAHGGGFVQHGSTYYWIGEDKTNGSAFQNIKCYSSTDLVHWTFRLNVLTRQSGGDLGPNRVIERPKLVYNDGTRQWVMYMHVDSSNYADARAGVATSGAAGPCDDVYVYRGSFRPLNNMARDMTLFKDTDGRAYLAASANNNADMVIYALSSDYLSVSQEIYRLPGQSRESPAIFKVDGVYFMITSGTSGWAPNMQKYMSATSLAGPWSGLRDLTPGSSTSYDSQTTHVLPVSGTQTTTYVYLGDRWFGDNLPDSRYVWLPLTVDSGSRTLGMSWYDSWTIDTATGAWAAGPTVPAVSLVARHSGKVADVKDGSTADRAAVIQWSSNGGSNQRWRFQDAGGGYFRVVNVKSGKCMDVTSGSTADSAAVIQYTCGGGANQQWQVRDMGSGYAQLVARHSGKCLDVKGASSADGAVLIQYSCGSGSNQQWQRRQ